MNTKILFYIKRIMPFYDFIEVGTSNFNTELEKADDTSVGLSIEPVKFYLDDLPNRKKVTKVNVALSNYTGYINIHYVSPKNIKRYGLPNWARGCNAVDKHHPTIKRLIIKKGLNPDKIFVVKKVRVLQFKELVKKYRITGINFLKIDTEGHDATILNNYLDYVEKRPKLKAKRIKFESNVLTKKREVANLITRLKKNGYKLLKTGQDTIMVLKRRKSNSKKKLKLKNRKISRKLSKISKN